MTFEGVLSAVTPLLHDGETAAITKSDDAGDRMITLTGTTRKTGIYDHGTLRIEKAPHSTEFSAWAIVRSHHWAASRRNPAEAREAITDILAAIKSTN